MSEPAVWGPILIAASVLWIGGWITQAVQAANNNRQRDHEELINELRDIASGIGRISLTADSIESNTSPPIDKFDPPM